MSVAPADVTFEPDPVAKPGKRKFQVRCLCDDVDTWARDPGALRGLSVGITHTHTHTHTYTLAQAECYPLSLPCGLRVEGASLRVYVDDQGRCVRGWGCRGCVWVCVLVSRCGHHVYVLIFVLVYVSRHAPP
jgi:hypothetical protein